ncbi:MAG: serine protease [Candidatus Korobacteraceae bacterium]
MRSARNSFVLCFVSFVPSFLAVLTPVRVDAQITFNILARVLNVRVHAATPQEAIATAFTVDVDGREYLITAKHVVQGLRDKDKIDIFTNDNWSSLDVEIFRCNDPVDIAVLIPPRQLTVNFDLPSENIEFRLGQDAFFLGFPYGIRPAPKGLKDPYPLPIVKRGTISGVVPLSDVDKSDLILLDGYNNPGFSGGPIVVHDLKRGGVALDLIGVVSGFRPEVVPVMKKHDIPSPASAGNEARAQPWRINRRSDGTYFEYVDNGEYVALNTGIVVGYGIQPAIDLIRQHPVGPEARDIPGNVPSM